jgi:hypothetical protein
VVAVVALVTAALLEVEVMFSPEAAGATLAAGAAMRLEVATAAMEIASMASLLVWAIALELAASSVRQEMVGL